MAVLGLFMIAVWFLAVAGVPTYVRARRSADVVGRVRVSRGSAQWWARVVSGIGFALAVTAQLADLAGLDPITMLDRAPIRAAGVVLFAVGVAATLVAQGAMGASWRPDVDPGARTALVTTGPFRLVRNPIFSATVATAVGLALVVPNMLAAAMLVAFVVALEIQVRMVEEPHLRRVHGASFMEYATRTGRFLPWLGQLRCPPTGGVGDRVQGREPRNLD